MEVGCQQDNGPPSHQDFEKAIRHTGTSDVSNTGVEKLGSSSKEAQALSVQLPTRDRDLSRFKSA